VIALRGEQLEISSKDINRERAEMDEWSSIWMVLPYGKI